jgi:hypothetical protein
VTEALFHALIKTLLATLSVRIRDIITASKPASASASGDTAQVSKAVYKAVVEAREVAWAAEVLLLRSAAKSAGASEGWVPDTPPYSQRAVDAAIRQVQGSLWDDNGIEQFTVTMERHVQAAAWQTAVDAVEDAPASVPLLEAVDRIDKDLADFPAAVRSQVVAEVQAHEKAMAAKKSVSLDEAFDQIVERVHAAINVVEESGLMTDAARKGGAVEKVSRSARVTKDGKWIARAFAWARVTHDVGQQGPCGFCTMLASRGPVYSSSYAAGARADAFHDHCYCTIVAVYTSREWSGKDASAQYASRYDELVRKGDLHGAEARTAMDNDARGTRTAEKNAARARRRAERRRA